MATYYTGSRNVLRGRDGDDALHPVTGEPGKYSHYYLNHGSQILSGAPDNDVELGVERPYSSIGLLEYIYAGRFHLAPLRDPGENKPEPLVNHKPYMHQGLPGAEVFRGDYGHSPFRTTLYSRHSGYIFQGLDHRQPLADPGHEIRYNLSYGGPFQPHAYQGVTDSPLADISKTVPEGHDGPYGHNKINEWRGTPSSKAL